MTSWEKSLHVLASAADARAATLAQEEDDTPPPWAASLVASSFGGTNEAERGNSHFFLTTLMRGQGCPRKR